MTLSLDEITANFYEILSLPEGSSVDALAVDLAGRRLYNGQRGWGLWCRFIAWIRDSLLFQHTEEGRRLATITNTYKAILAHLEEAKRERQEYYEKLPFRPQVILKREPLSDKAHLFQFINIFGDIFKKGEQIKRIAAIMDPIFGPERTLALTLAEEMKCFEKIQALQDFILFTNHPIPLADFFYFVVNPFNRETASRCPDLKEWFRNILYPPHWEAMTENEILKWRSLMIWKLAQLLPVMWRVFHEIHCVKVSYDEWVVALSKMGMPEKFDTSTPVEVQEIGKQEALVQSPTISYFFQYPRVAKESCWPMRALLRISPTGRSAVMEEIVRTFQDDLAQQVNLFKTLFERKILIIRTHDKVFDPNDFKVVYEKGEEVLKTIIPYSLAPFDITKFDEQLCLTAEIQDNYNAIHIRLAATNNDVWQQMVSMGQEAGVYQNLVEYLPAA